MPWMGDVVDDRGCTTLCRFTGPVAQPGRIPVGVGPPSALNLIHLARFCRLRCVEVRGALAFRIYTRAFFGV